MTDAHDQAVTHSYIVHYPAHPPRAGDPHYKDFEAYKRRTKANAKCAVGEHRSDFSECHGELELHHAHVEFSLQNGVDLKWLEADYPGISDPNSVGAWVESAANLMWLCEFHHRGHGGVHVASASDFEAEKYVRGLIVERAKQAYASRRLAWQQAMGGGSYRARLRRGLRHYSAAWRFWLLGSRRRHPALPRRRP